MFKTPRRWRPQGCIAVPLLLLLGSGGVTLWSAWKEITELARQEAGLRWLRSRVPASWESMYVGRKAPFPFRPYSWYEALKSTDKLPWGGPSLDLWPILRHCLGEFGWQSLYVDTLWFQAHYSHLGQMSDTDWAVFLGSFPWLEVARLEAAPIRDRHLRYLARAPRLRWLFLSSTPITGEGLAYLRNLPIEHLDLRSVDMNESGIQAVAQLKTVEVLAADGDDALAAQLSQLRNLEILSFFRSKRPTKRLTDAGLKHIVGMPSLKHLLFDSPYVSDTAMGFVGRNAGLETLEVIAERITDDGIAALARSAVAGRLSELAVESPGLTDAALRHVAHMHLRTLELRRSPITDAGLRHLRECQSLRFLSFVQTRLTGVGFKELEGLEGLRAVKLSGGPISDVGLAAIGRLKGLRALTLQDVPVSGKGFQDWLVVSKLEWLDLAGSRISDEGVAALAKCAGLRSLNLARTKITDRAVPSLAALRDLEQLDLSSTGITDEGIKYLQDIKQLREVYLFGTKVTDKGIEQLRSTLPAVRIITRNSSAPSIPE